MNLNHHLTSQEESKEEHFFFASIRQKNLSQEEKAVIRHSIENSIYTSGHLSSSFHKSSFFMRNISFLTQRSFVFSALSIILVLGSGFGIAKASEKALPGQTLYPMKINVNEPLIAKFKFSDTSRILWEKELAGRRIEEAEALAERGALGEIEKMQIEQELYEHKRVIESIEGHTIDDDELFPETLKNGMSNVNVRVEYNAKDTFIHIEERFETAEDEEREAQNGYQDENEDEDHIFMDVYTKDGVKVKNIQKTEKEAVEEEKKQKKIVELKRQREGSFKKEKIDTKENTDEKKEEVKDDEQKIDDEEKESTKKEEEMNDDEDKD